MSELKETIHQFGILSSGQLETILCLMTVSIGFIAYHFLSEHLKKYYSTRNTNLDPSYLSTIIQRFLGLMFLGIIPLVTLFAIGMNDIESLGISFNSYPVTLLSILIVSSLIIAGNYFIGKKKSNYLIYPQMRIKKWNTKFMLVNAITWLIYLGAYEMAFRGILIFPFIDLLGIELTVALNISIYALVHVPKGKKETLGAIPLGFVLCIITISTKSIFPAFVIHAIMAISNDIYAMKANPKMSIKIL